MFFRGYTPLSNYKPYINLSQIKNYAPEENEVSDENFTLGIGQKASAKNKRLSSDVDLVLYLAGTRVAPNLIPYSPLLSVEWKNKMFLIGTSYNPKLDIMLDGVFYFERKYQATLITQHDGLAGTKREFDIKVGLEYYWKKYKFSLVAYGNNNLNRGYSPSLPSGFRDSVYGGISYRF